MRGLARWLRGFGAAEGLMARLGAGYIALVWRTTRWRVEGQGNLDALLAEEAGFLVSCWHGRLFLTPCLAPPGRRTMAMISNNRDGDLIAAIVARFGIDAVRGSTYDRAKRRDKGGAEALRAAVRALTADRACLCITPDGPRGPRMQAQPGIAQIAASARVKTLPVAFATRRGRALSSWDRFWLPAPFGRGAVVYGTPIPPAVSTDAAATEERREAVERATIRVTRLAERICGGQPAAERG